MTAPVDLDPRLLRLLYAYDREAPLDASESVVGEQSRVRTTRFECTSTHGLRVRGLLRQPIGHADALPLVLLAREAGANERSSVGDALGLQCVRHGMACATVEIELSDSVCVAIGGELRRAGMPLLPWSLRERVVQCSVDLRRCLDLLETRPGIDATRAGLLGFGEGACIGLAAAAFDVRLRAAVLVQCGTGLLRRLAVSPDEQALQDLAQAEQMVEPRVFAPLLAGRPLLLINGLQDQAVPPESARALFEALPEPKRLRWYEGGRAHLSPSELEEAFTFLHETLRA